MQKQGSEAGRITSDEALDLRWSTRSRCLAVLRELDAELPDWESIVVLLQGAAEDIEAAT
jgi:hypothetical protein